MSHKEATGRQVTQITTALAALEERYTTEIRGQLPRNMSSAIRWKWVRMSRCVPDPMKHNLGGLGRVQVG